MANYDAQINILVSGQRNINNLANQLNQIESSITEIESRWRSASDAFQRSEIRLRAAGTRQPRGEGGRFARDPDRQARFRAYADRRRALVEQRLARISLSRTTAEAAASREQIDNNERLLRQTERRISFESRLNTANERYQYRLQKLRRGGGGRNLSQELQDQARSIQNAYNAAGGAASRNLRLIRSLSIELGVVVERQNEYNRLQALSSKGFEAGRRLQERITDIRDLGVQPEATIRGLRSQAAQVISDSRIGDQQAYSESLRSAKAAVARAERDAKQLVKSASDINEEYQKQLSLRDKIGDSALDAATKESLSVQAARALEALMENRLVLAKEITEQVERQLKLESQALEADRRINSTAQLANQQILGAENALTLAKDVEAYGRSLEKTKSVTEDILSLGEDLGRDFDQRLKKLDAEKKLRSDIASITELAAQKVTGTEESLELGKNIELYSKNLQKTQDAAEDILSIGEDLGKDFDERLKKLDAEKKLRADIQLAEQKVTGAEESFGLARDLESYSKALENTRGITEDILSLGEGLGRDFDERLKKLDAEKKLRSDIASAAELAAQKISGREESFGLARDLELYSKSLQKTQDVTEEILSLGKNLGKDFDERLKKLDSEKKLRADIASAAELAAQKISGAESSLGLSKDMEAYLNGLQKVENATKDILSLGEGLGKDFDKRLKKITTEKKLKENVAIEIASAAISEQSLINLQNKGVNVATELLSLQEALNEAKRIDGQISQETLDNLKKQITFANKKATLENRRLAGKGGGDSGATGFSTALSSAEIRKQVNQIYKDFDKAVAGNAGEAGENVTSTFASNLKKGIPNVIAASTSFASASIDAILKKFGMRSPSRVMIEIARNLVDTYVNVLEAAIPEIQQASKKAFAAPTNLDVASARLPKSQDRIDAISEFIASILDPMESRGLTTSMASAFVTRKGQRLDLWKIPGLDMPAAETASVRGQYNDPNFQKLRQSIVEFYNIPSEFAPDVERATAAAGESSESAKRLEAEVADLVSGLGKISNLFQKATDFIRVPVTPSERAAPPAQQKTTVDLIDDYWSSAAANAEELDKKLKLEFSGPGAANTAALVDFWDTALDDAQKIVKKADEVAAEGGLGGAGAGGAGGAGGGGGFGGGGRGGGGAGGAAPIGPEPIEDLEQALRERRLGPIARATNDQLEELARRLQEIRNRADATSDEFRQLGRDLAVLGRQQERRDPGAEFLTRRVGPRAGRAISEGLVGGAFPLLFGQGVGSAVLGGAGGAAGGFAGGGLGFGLSLLGTAGGQVVDNFINNLKSISESLRDPAQTLVALEEAGFAVDNSVKQTVERLLEANNVYEAQAVALRQITDTFGAGSVQLLNAYEQETKKLGDSYQDLSATIVRSLLPALVGAVAVINDLSRGTKGIEVSGNVLKILNLLSPTGLLAGAPIELLERRGRQAAKEAGSPSFPDNPAAAEAAIKATEEYEKRQGELEKETKTLNRALEEQRKYNSEIQNALTFRNAEQLLAKQLIAYRRQERQIVETILQKEEELGEGRTVEEQKRIEEQLNVFRKLEYEKLRQLSLENQKQIFDAQEDNIKKIQELNESNAKSYRDMRLQIERQIEDERISAARRIEDAELKGARAVLDFKEKGLQIIQNQRREQIELASAIRGLESQFSADPSREGLAAQLSAAVDQYKNGLAEADENRKLAEEKIQLDAREAALAIERFKQDNARRVARINEDSVKKIAEINSRIDKQRNESYKYAYDLTVERLIAREEAAANQIRSQKAANAGLVFSPFVSEAQKKVIEDNSRVLEIELSTVQANIARLRRLSEQLPATPQVQNVGSLPVMTSQANEVSAVETQLNSLIQAGRERLLQLEQQNTKEGAAAKLARQALQIIDSQRIAQTQITESLNKRIEDAQRYKQLLASGINPELARQMAAIEGASARISDVIEMTIKQLEALNDPKFKGLIETLRGIQQNQPTIVSEQIGKTKKALELEKPTLTEGISAEINQLKKDLDPITVATNSIVNGANAIGSAFGQSFQDIASGAKSTEQALADTFESIGKAFLGMAAEIIAKQLAMITLQAVLKALGGPSIGLPSVNQQSAIDIGRAASFEGGGYTGYGSRIGGIDGRGGFPAILHPNETVIDHTGPALFTPSSIPNIRTEGSPMRPESGVYPGSGNGPTAEASEAAAAPLPFTRNAESLAPAQAMQQAATAQLPFTRNAESIAQAQHTAQTMQAAGPIDVRYESQVINGVEYVTAEQHRKGMAQAAERGRALTLQALQNSPRTRSKVGI